VHSSPSLSDVPSLEALSRRAPRKQYTLTMDGDRASGITAHEGTHNSPKSLSGPALPCPAFTSSPNRRKYGPQEREKKKKKKKNLSGNEVLYGRHFGRSLDTQSARARWQYILDGRGREEGSLSLRKKLIHLLSTGRVAFPSGPNKTSYSINNWGFAGVVVEN